MSIQRILQYVGKVVFNRGKDYYKKGNILSFNENQHEIIAIVKGTASQKFTVKITFDKEKNIQTSECSCPLWDRCKHIAAVLLHYYEIIPGSDTAGPVITREVPENNNIYRVDFAGTVDPWIKSIVNNIHDKYINPVKDRDDKTWKLFFRIKHTSYNPGDGTGWEVSPVIRYVKKDGSLGSIYNYSPKKQLMPLAELEQALLYKLLEKDNHKDSLPHYLDLFITNPGLPLLLVSGYKYNPVVIKEIIKVKVCFKLVSVAKGKLNFRTHLKLFLDHEHFVSTFDVKHHMFKHGADLFFILNSGLLLYKKKNIIFTDFLMEIIDKILLPPDIDFLKQFTGEYFNNDVEVEFTTSMVKLVKGVPEPVIELTGDVIGNTNIHLVFKYRGKQCSSGSKQMLLVMDQTGNEIIAIKRDFAAEKNLISFFEQLIRDVTLVNHYEHSSDYKIRISVAGFIVQYGAVLMDHGFSVSMGKSRKLAKNTGKLSIFVKSGINWFDMEMKYIDTDGKASAVQIEESDLAAGMIQVADRYVLLKRADIESIRKLQYEGINKEGKLKVSKLNFNLLEEFAGDISVENPQEIRKYQGIYKKLKSIQSIDNKTVAAGLICTLRNYQLDGYNWLIFLHEQEISGCLADDMGLGKTIQTIALLQYLKEQGSLGPVLLVVPVTLIANWESEINRFSTGLSHIRHVGKKRMETAAQLTRYDLVIISYHTLRIDIEFFNQIQFDYLILDESQNIKNAFTQTYKAIKMIQSRHRLALTGTPVENNTLELWSQMEFLNPGLLKTIPEFKKRFAVPIEEYGDREAADRLKKLISPFILRRKKEDVISELPEKEIIVCYSEMNILQREAYIAVRNSYQIQIREIISRKGLKRSKFEIFNAILRLRQMVLFPGLVDIKYAGIESCKFEMLREMLEEILEEEHKVLIFSQFVQVLQRIREYLDRKLISYCYIDGSTQKRDREIRMFQEKPDRKIFLLSLKAGGTGINLTAADYVILFDPWWNPAVENQAIDRTHRIGQTKKVIGYKMIVKNSIEEKILSLQERKADLVNKIITEDKSVFKMLSEDDIIDLFQ